jgi:hypothetical protein
MSLLENSKYLSQSDSELEDLFAYNLDKYLSSDVKLLQQVEVSTICGKYKLDFVAKLSNGQSIAFECDGAEFHDARRDEWRDAMILGEKEISTIYRFPGSALFYHMEDCLYFLSRWEPHLFSSSGLVNLKRLASPKALDADESRSFDRAFVIYPPSEASGPYMMTLERHTIDAPAEKRSFLKYAFEYAQSSGISDLDKIMAQHLA